MRRRPSTWSPDLITYHLRRMAGELPSGALRLPHLPFRLPEEPAGPRVEVPQVNAEWRRPWATVPPRPRRPS